MNDPAPDMPKDAGERLHEVRQRAAVLMASLGKQELDVPLQRLGWRFEFDRAKRRLGCCHWRKGGAEKKITLSRHLVAEHGLSFRDADGLQVVEDVLRHEIAHAVDFEQRGRSAHDAAWKRICRRVGADPSRTYDGDELMRAPSRYVARCPKCGREQSYYRLPKKRRACRYCCNRHNAGRYDARFEVVLTDRRSGKRVPFGEERRTKAGGGARGYKYTAVCPSCGARTGFRRRVRRKYACRSCCETHAEGAFDDRFVMVIRQNY